MNVIARFSLALVGLLVFILLATLRTRNTKRSALYVLFGLLIRGSIRVVLVFPTLASCLEKLPQMFQEEYQKEEHNYFPKPQPIIQTDPSSCALLEHGRRELKVFDRGEGVA